MKSSIVVRRLVRWFARNARALPWRRTRDPYAIWVSEIMLQQTQVKTVLPFWERWMSELPDIKALARANAAKLHKLWEGLGYYARVRNLHKGAQRIVEQHGGTFPKDFDQVLELPGIGRYTAGAICSIAFNQPKPILDGNVMRVLARVFGVAGNPRAKGTNARLWGLADELVRQAARPADFNQALMELGALVCTPRQPRCNACPIREQCVALRQGRVLELPGLGQRVRTTPRRFAAFVARHRKRFLVRQRAANGVNAHLWEFPNVEVGLEDTDVGRAARKALGLTPKTLQPLCVIKHSITRYRITLEVFQAVGYPVGRISRARGQWLAEKELSRRAFASAHKRILRRLGIK
jgi:A/G-specific adenine glycosylase